METEKKLYGYARVSSKDQNEDRQIIALCNAGVPRENIFVDKMSGKDLERPQYKSLLRKLNDNTVLYVKSLDRLGRNYSDLIAQWQFITKEKKSDLYIMDMPLIDTRRDKNLLGTFISDVVLSIFSYVAEQERINIRERQAEGIAAAKARGVRFGRAPMPLPENFHQAYQSWKMKEVTVEEAARMCGMAKTTFFDRAKTYGKSEG